jgi:hypothetical protein
VLWWWAWELGKAGGGLGDIMGRDFGENGGGLAVCDSLVRGRGWSR